MRTEEQKARRLAHYLFGISLLEKKGYTKHTLPTWWASYLVNGDASGLEDGEQEEIDRRTSGIGRCVNVKDDSRFSVYAGIGCDVSTYIFYKEV